jgi:hypothetical protein
MAGSTVCVLEPRRTDSWTGISHKPFFAYAKVCKTPSKNVVGRLSDTKDQCSRKIEDK